MGRRALTAGVVALGALTFPAAAQQTIESYYMSLGPQDFVNSRGQRLENFGQAIQQDRANYHRFGRRDPADEGDRLFGDAQTRAEIPALVAAYPNNRAIASMSPGRTNFADYLVTVCAINGKLSHTVVNYADGDGYLEC